MGEEIAVDGSAASMVVMCKPAGTRLGDAAGLGAALFVVSSSTRQLRLARFSSPLT